jgi:hypothetical protein
MAKFRSRFSFNKIHPELQQPGEQKQTNDEQQQQQQQHENLTTDDKRKNFYTKIFPSVNSFKNKVYPSNLASADHVKINENGPIIGNLDKYHTVNIYSNTYKETTKR